MPGTSDTSLQPPSRRTSRGGGRTLSSGSLPASAPEGFQPGALGTLPEVDGSEEFGGEEDEESWDLSLEQYPATNLLEKPFNYFLGTKGKVCPDRLSLQQIFYWFTNAQLLDGKLLSPTHLSLAFNQLRMSALALPDFEELLEVLCTQRLLREDVLRDRLVDPRVLRPPGKRLSTTESEESSEASDVQRPSLLFLDEEEGEYGEDAEEDGFLSLARGTTLVGTARGSSQGTPRPSEGRRSTMMSRRSSKLPSLADRAGDAGSKSGGSKTNV